MTPKQLADRISTMVPEDYNVVAFAEAIADVMEQQYGGHNYKLFTATIMLKLNTNGH